jgi:hypothetical protein
MKYFARISVCRHESLYTLANANTVLSYNSPLPPVNMDFVKTTAI